MLFVWIGFLKADVDEIPQSLQQQASDFLRQPLIRISAAGPLRDAAGRRAAMMMIFEQDSREAAESLVSNSPYLAAGFYEDHRLYEFDNQVG